jgi:N-acetylmuramoyl-L-alanine amidase
MLGKYSIGSLGILAAVAIASPILADGKGLTVSYPPTTHKTDAEQIFAIGSAPTTGEVKINEQVVPRSPNGHFASVLPLKIGKNTISIEYKGQTKTLTVTRTAPVGLELPTDKLDEKSLEPQADTAKMVGEEICFGAVGPKDAKVSVDIGGQNIKLKEQTGNKVPLPDNKAALIDRNQPQAVYGAGHYLGCAIAVAAADLGKPTYKLETKTTKTTAPAPKSKKEEGSEPTGAASTTAPNPIAQLAPGNVQVLAPNNLDIAEVKVENAVARTGASSDFSRITPLPKGTRASITGRQAGNNNGKQANWVRLDYGAWVLADEVNILPSNGASPRTIVRSITSKQREGATDVVFPLQVSVPMTIEQGNGNVTLTLYNATAQTDIIKFGEDPVVSRLDWRQTAPGIIKYVFTLKQKQQWGYKLQYQGTSLVLSLRHPPKLGNDPNKPLAGTKILLDPGHGGDDSGAVGPNGYTEKDANLYASKLLANELAMRGAAVYLTRETDKAISLEDRRRTIEALEPTLAFSVHHNSLPDGGNPSTKGFSTFWYHPQAQSISLHLHNHIVQKLGRPSYGVFWDNLALARPTAAPSVLLELGFMSNPTEFEQSIANPAAQQAMARSLAEGMTQWIQTNGIK